MSAPKSWVRSSMRSLPSKKKRPRIIRGRWWSAVAEGLSRQAGQVESSSDARAIPQPSEGFAFDLTDALTGQAHFFADFAQRAELAVVEPLSLIHI